MVVWDHVSGVVHHPLARLAGVRRSGRNGLPWRSNYVPDPVLSCVVLGRLVLGDAGGSV